MLSKIHLVVFLALLLLIGCSRSSTPPYRIAIDPSWYPVEIAGRQKNLLAFSNELLQEIAKEKGLHLSIVSMSWDNLLWGLDQEKYDAVLSSLYPYIFYEKKYHFSDLYFPTGPVLVLPMHSKASSLNKMIGKQIAVLRGSAASVLLQKYPGVILQSYDSIPQALNDLVENSVDAAAVDIVPAQAYVRDLYFKQLKLGSAPLDNQGLRLITLQNKSDKLLSGFNEGLNELKKNGKYDAMLKKWGLSSDPNFRVEIGEQSLEHLFQYIIL